METGDAAEWLRHAESDLTYAKLGEVQQAILRNQVAFHAEQAAEKAFKAVLVHAAVEFPRTHDLQSLLLLLRNSGISTGPEIEQASALTRFAVEARYPGTSSRSHERKLRWRLRWPREPSCGRRKRKPKFCSDNWTSIMRPKQISRCR
jgi:HEPN domain-containing protein